MPAKDGDRRSSHSRLKDCLAGPQHCSPATFTMLSPLQYFAVLALVCAYAFFRGRSDERFAASVCAAASVASVIAMTPLTQRYSEVETGVFLIDGFTLIAFTLLALRSDRFWPLWIAGLQLTTLISHALKAVQLDLMPHAYAAAARFWVYPIVLIIVVGTWRGHRRRLQEQRLTLA
jgi:hypothetical protein